MSSKLLSPTNLVALGLRMFLLVKLICMLLSSGYRLTNSTRITAGSIIHRAHRRICLFMSTSLPPTVRHLFGEGCRPTGKLPVSRHVRRPCAYLRPRRKKRIPCGPSGRRPKAAGVHEPVQGPRAGRRSFGAGNRAPPEAAAAIPRRAQGRNVPSLCPPAVARGHSMALSSASWIMRACSAAISSVVMPPLSAA